MKNSILVCTFAALLCSSTFARDYYIPEYLPENVSVPILLDENPAPVMNMSDFAGCKIISASVQLGNSGNGSQGTCLDVHLELLYSVKVVCPKKHPKGAGEHELRMGGGMVGLDGWVVNPRGKPQASRPVPAKKVVDVYKKLVEENKKWRDQMDGMGPNPHIYFPTGRFMDPAQLDGVCGKIPLFKKANCRDIAGDIYDDLMEVVKSPDACRKDSDCGEWHDTMLPGVKAWTSAMCVNKVCALRSIKGGSCPLADSNGKRISRGMFEYACAPKLKCVATSSPSLLTGTVTTECQ